MKIHKKLKKVIHPNRYFIWAIAALLVLGAALVSYIEIAGMKISNESIFAELKTRKAYTNPKEGYTVRYPSDWVLEYDNSGNPVFENPGSLQESLSIAAGPLDLDGVIRHSIGIKSEKDIAKDNLKIAIIKAGSAKDDSALDIAIIKTSRRLYYISGHSSMIEAFARNFKVQ